MKDPVIVNLVEQLKIKISEINSLMSLLDDNDVIVQLSVGRETAIKPSAISIVSLIQTHDYLQ